MPELPEVETVRRTLAPHVVGQWVVAVEVTDPTAVRFPLPPQAFVRGLAGGRIEGLTRRGKYLLALVTRPEGGTGTWVTHLRMSGRLLWHPGPVPASPDPHLRVRVVLGDKSHVDLVDTRRLGEVYLAEPGGRGLPAGLRRLGPDPLDPAFSRAALGRLLRGRRASIKALLLRQDVVAGVGNIYADEALFAAGIHPARAAGSLTDQEVARLHRALRQVLRAGIRHGGVSVRTYVDAEGRPGRMAARLRVYGRGGHPCQRCGEPLRRLTVAGRGTVVCPSCQR